MKSETYPEFVARIWKPGTREEQLTHAALGLAGECGEVVDIIKKHVIYGKELNRDKIMEEMGDMLYYFQALINTIGTFSMEGVEANNHFKLSRRFHLGQYSAQQAMARADQA